MDGIVVGKGFNDIFLNLIISDPSSRSLNWLIFIFSLLSLTVIVSLPSDISYPEEKSFDCSREFIDIVPYILLLFYIILVLNLLVVVAPTILVVSLGSLELALLSFPDIFVLFY